MNRSTSRAVGFATLIFLLLVMSAASPISAQVAIFTDQNSFTAASGALLEPFPSEDMYGFELFFDHLTVTAPNASSFPLDGIPGNVLYDAPPLRPTATNPFPTTGNIAANGEDDYLLTFNEPVNAVGLTFVTNYTASQRITLKDETGNIIFDDSIDDLTSPNSVFFIGFTSSVPIKSLFLDTTNGAAENEAITEIWLPYVVEPPPPACQTLTGDQNAFVTANGASLVSFPSEDMFGYELVFDGVTVTAPDGSPIVLDGVSGNILYDAPPFRPNPTNPFPTTGNIAANGEDDYLLTFTQPVNAVGLKIITNYTASERVVLRDENGNVLFDGSVDALTSPNSIAFIGINSCVPFKSLLLDTTDGGAENEPIIEIWASGGGNQTPVANAGPDQSAAVDTVVTLDGTQSSDPDGDSLTFDWSLLSMPSGSTAMLSNRTTPNPTFTVDKAGSYTAQLVVSDGQLSSIPDTVVITTMNSAPTAEAGQDQSVAVGAAVSLNGNQSFDPDGDALSYTWSFSEVPPGSAASLSDPSSVNPSFIVDKAGTYRVSLVVSDGSLTSTPDFVTISTVNSAPIANAGGNQSVNVGDIVVVDGSGSTDPDGDTLTYDWALLNRPQGSSAALSNSTSVSASFVADREGSYNVQLKVSDGILSSTTTIIIVAVDPATVAADLVKRIINNINALPPPAFRNPNMARALTNRLDAVLRHIENGQYGPALNQVENDIIQKTDGCALAGAPDANDFIVTCAAQDQIYPDLIELRDLLRELAGP